MQIAKQINFGVIGPASADDNAVARFDGATGKKIQNSLTLVSDLGLLTTPDAVVGASAKSGTEKLRVTGGSVLFDGTTGGTPVSGAGTRLMWVPEKKAFRAGYAGSTEWDNSNIGSYSIAMGFGPKAIGSYGIAIGRECEASGQQAVAIGPSSKAEAISTIALGLLAKASNSYSLAIGSMVGNGTVLASGTASLAIGAGCGHPYLFQQITSSGSGSLVIATTTTMITAQASNTGAVLIGSSLDGSSNASGQKSLILTCGGNINATANYSMAIGKSFTNNVASSCMIGFSSTPALQIICDKVGVNMLPTTYALEINGQVNATGGFVDNGNAGVDGWFDDGVNFRITVNGGIITAIANSTTGGHS